MVFKRKTKDHMVAYELVRPVVTKCHKLGVLETQTFIVSPSWRPDV